MGARPREAAHVSERVNVSVSGWRRVPVASQRGNKSRSRCHKTQSQGFLKCCLYSQTAADGEERKRGRKTQEKRGEGVCVCERGEGEWGGVRRLAEGLILNAVEKLCLLSSLASSLTELASKQDLYPPPPHGRKILQWNIAAFLPPEPPWALLPQQQSVCFPRCSVYHRQQLNFPW